MIVDHLKTGNSNKNKSQTVLKRVLSSKSFNRLTHTDISQFLNNHELIDCALSMSMKVSYQKLVRIYLILFQVCTSNSEQTVTNNFVTQYNFQKKLSETCSKIQCNKSQKIILKKIAKFLDSFKYKICIKTQLNSLVNQYHQFRQIDSTATKSQIVQGCDLIREYIYRSIQDLGIDIESAQWDQMNDQVFEKFYVEKYSEICTIFKRVNYINSAIMNLPVFEISPQLRRKIQEKYMTIQRKKWMVCNQYEDPSESPIQSVCELKINEEIQETKQQKIIQIPVLNVKKRLKAINNVINQMRASLPSS